jgi:hypothetical protein
VILRLPEDGKIRIEIVDMNETGHMRNDGTVWNGVALG